MAVKKGLGKGLDSLITDKVNTKPAVSKNNPTPKSEHAADAIMMNITKVEPNREQPRKKFDEDALLELAESIKQYGVLQPLLVQEREDYYEIVAGERRWRAAKIAGIKEIPVIIKKLTRQEIMEISLIENIQREDLNPIEEALAFKRLLTEFNLKQDEVAERVSKSRTAVTNAMRLLKLNEKVQQMVIDEMLTTGHARALLGIEDQEQQYIIAQKIFDEKLSVRDTEKLVKSLQNEKKKKKEEKEKDPMDEAIKSLEGTADEDTEKTEEKKDGEAKVVPAEEMDRSSEGMDRAVALGILKAMRPTVAAIQDPAQRQAVSDALIKLVTTNDAKSDIHAILNASQANAKKAEDKAPAMDVDQCQAAYDARNPHKRKENS